ncbi:MAG: guanosine monophosphate reductase [Candidatus Pacebacteria bacterium CG10_big_fil_rev_8_21_14_0_10_44_11]|nr:MAG: guanosine monophosphate reductase [Candidatus Pacebacteria bacterium CG10_big_fil_rev_8_21_14_0_10_44_11]
MFTAQELASLQEYLTYDDVLLLPNYSDITPSQTDVSTNLTKTIKLGIPLVASPMDTVCEAKMAIALAQLGGYGIIHRNFSVEGQAAELKQVLKHTDKVGVAVGVGADFEERVKALVKAGAKEICIDSAHGHTKNVIAAIKHIKKQFPKVEVIAGNVATYDGALALFKAGAAAVKVGMGPGSICTTRVMSGMGVPQLSAVVEGVRAAKETGGYIIADGGIKTSGDIVKALAAGADTVMLGSLLAGTDESPGQMIEVNGKMFKSYRGMGSISAMKKGSAARYGQEWEKGKTKQLVPEGVEGLVPHRGSLEDHVYQLIGGLRAGLGYLGAKNLKELQKKATFIKISRTAFVESQPHSIVRT